MGTLTSFPAPRASKQPSKAPLTSDSRPPALAEIEDFLDQELHSSPRQNQSAHRLETHRGAFDLFIAHFGTYAEPLSRIKQEYERNIDALRAECASATKQRLEEVTAAQQDLTTSLADQLQRKEAQLASALEQLRVFQVDESSVDRDAWDDDEPSAPDPMNDNQLMSQSEKADHAR